jgi:putative flippase GtrA
MNHPIKKLLKSFFWFGLVGFSAMIVHFYAVVAIFIPLNIQPLIANTLGFLIAFIVSYLGHTHLTFHDPNNQHKTIKSLLRFLGVAIFGFLINQLIFYIMLSFTQLGINVSLAITLILVSGSTYLLSKFWVFKITAHD